jgi:hypothetical protein
MYYLRREGSDTSIDVGNDSIKRRLCSALRSRGNGLDEGGCVVLGTGLERLECLKNKTLVTVGGELSLLVLECGDSLLDIGLKR